MKSHHTYQPTPITWEWWRVTIANIVRSFSEPREITPAEIRAQVIDRDARMRACLRGEVLR